MIFHDGFACRRFDITAEGSRGTVEMAGNFIIWLPQGNFRSSSESIHWKTGSEFLRQIPTPRDLWEINQQLGRTMRGRTHFFSKRY